MALPHPAGSTDPALAMAGWRYQLIRPCPAVSIPEIKTDPEEVRTLVIPLGEFISVVAGPFNGDRIVDIEWDSKLYMMFTLHLKKCARRVP